VVCACRENLQADAGAEYDQLIEINLNELEPHVNGPFTPDLAHPLSKFADAIRANGWPSELKVCGCVGVCLGGELLCCAVLLGDAVLTCCTEWA
jgi:aconitate hydratase